MTGHTTRRQFLASAGLAAATAAAGHAAAGGLEGSGRARVAQEPGETWDLVTETGAWSSGNAVAQRPDGGFVLAGEAGRSDESGQRGQVIAFGDEGGVDWETPLAPEAETMLQDVAPTDDGGCVAVGTTRELDDWTSAEALLAKLDADGEVAWRQRFAGQNRGAEATAVRPVDDEFVVAGGARDDDGYDGWFFRTAADGTMAWERTYGPGRTNGLRGFAPVGDGYVAWGTTNAGDGDDRRGWFLRIDGEGHRQWDERYRAEIAGGYNGYNVVADATETVVGYLLVGYTAPSEGSSSYTGWALQVNKQGDVVDRRQYDDPQQGVFTSVVGADGTYVLGGQVQPSSSEVGGWLLAADEGGAVQWSKHLGEGRRPMVSDVLSTDDDGYVFAGSRLPDGGNDGHAWIGKVGGERVGTPTPTETATPTQTPTETADPSPTPAAASETTGTATAEGEATTRTAADGPGFGVGGALAALGIGAYAQYRGTPGSDDD